ncbi:RBM42 [Symbiodinium microadriaticum]|nr:RBM42 [Symbiodinium microadriaticum]
MMVPPGAVPMVQPSIGPAMPSTLTPTGAAQAAALGASTQKAPNERKAASVTLRKASGKVWRDPTLDDWPKEDYRLFCGDLGNEVTDDLLANAFRKYSSFQKAKEGRIAAACVTANSNILGLGRSFPYALKPESYLQFLSQDL